MNEIGSASARKQSAQAFRNGEIHDWYRIILGFSDHLVGGLMDEFGLSDKDRVLDPFCGAGTTLVEGMKRGLEMTGIDANPSSYFASTVKTNWAVSPSVLGDQIESIRVAYKRALLSNNLEVDDFYKYLEDFGYLRRWISVKPAKKIVAVKQAIASLTISNEYKSTLMLALMSEAVVGSSNVRFGPELYCGKARMDSAVFSNFARRVEKMCEDLASREGTSFGRARVLLGDSRQCTTYIRGKGQFKALICSPPYPTEHDYTRNSRIELALLGHATDRQTVRLIKLGMVRSHTKGIYKADEDAKQVSSHQGIQQLAAEIERKALSKTHGFARLYSKVLREYFGGLKRHFASVLPLMAPGAMCAYVVGDQSSYLRVHIPTAELLAELAVCCGFEHVETRHWRRRWSTVMSKHIAENILILRVPRSSSGGIGDDH